MARRQRKAKPRETTTKVRSRDYFSNLPPELLDSVFDFAYDNPGRSPQGPLSKKLVPQYLRGLYRYFTPQIFDIKDPRRETAVAGFYRYIRAMEEAGPKFGKHIRSLSVDDCDPLGSRAYGYLERLISFTSNLTTLSLIESNASAAFLVFLTDSPPAVLEKVRHVKELDYNPPGTTKLGLNNSVTYLKSFEPLSRLVSLQTLLLASFYPRDPSLPDEEFSLESLTSLRVYNSGETSTNLVSDLIDHCPRLRHLKFVPGELYHTHRHLVPDCPFLEHGRFLHLLPPTIKDLELSIPFPRRFRRFEDDLEIVPVFPRFANLESLTLRTQQPSDLFPYVRSLPRLQKLVLPASNLSTIASFAEDLFNDSLDLPPALRVVKLLFNCGGRIGRPFSPPSPSHDVVDPDKPDATGSLARSIPTMEEDGWVSVNKEIRTINRELKDLIEVANDRGVSIEGDAVRALYRDEAYEEERKRRAEYLRAQKARERAARCNSGERGKSNVMSSRGE